MKRTVKGIYVLVIQLNKNTYVRVGKLGKFFFTKGLYAYVGSAQVNLEKRIERHYKKEKQVFWHIDYLLQKPEFKIAKVFYETANKAEECKIANEIAMQGKPVKGFGCSDCKCQSHLFYLTNYSFLYEFMKEYVISNLSTVS